MTAVQPGDIVITAWTISGGRGTFELAPGVGREAVLLDWSICEDITQHYTIVEANVFDPNDALGTHMLSGDETITITFHIPGGTETPTFTFRMVELAKVAHHGTMSSKTYQIRGISPEMINAQKNRMEKSYNELTSEIVHDVVTTFFESTKTWDNPDPTRVVQRIVANNIHPNEFLDEIKNRHVSAAYDSSSYVLFESRRSGENLFRFATLEYLMQQGPTLGYILRQVNGLDALPVTDREEWRTIYSIVLPSSFHTPTQLPSATAQTSFNLQTGKLQVTPRDFDPEAYGFTADSNSPISAAMVALINSPPLRQFRGNVVDAMNDTLKTFITQMHHDKHAFMARALNDVGVMEVMGNPAFHVGETVQLILPNKSELLMYQGEEEREITGTVLMSQVVHHVRAPNVTHPQYTCVIRFIKAGYAEAVG